MGTLSFKNKMYFFKPSGLEDQKLATKAGFQLDPETKSYWTSHTREAIKLRKYADITAKENFDQLSRVKMKLPGSLSCPTHLTPRPYQIAGAWHILSHNRTYLADDPGLGKTIQFIIARNSAPGKTLIISPPSLCNNWESECRKWGSKKTSIKIITPESTDRDYFAEIVILPDTLLDRPIVLNMLSLFPWEWLAVDEVHRFKDIKTTRTQALFGRVGIEDDDSAYVPLYQLAKRVCVMSGTPMPNARPIELYPVLNALAPDTIDYLNYTDYSYRFCDAYETRYGLVNTGVSDMAELRARVRGSFMLRRLKKDVLKELPPKTRQIIFLDQTNKRMKKWEREAIETYDINEIVYNGDNPVGELATLRKEVGLSMVKPGAEFIREALESDTKKKMLVFCWHREVIDKLKAQLQGYKPIVIDGRVDGAQKHDLVRRFQSNKNYRLGILQITAGGVGHTLTEASRVIFLEPSWEDTTNGQAEDRAHRYGQKDHVLCQYLVSKGGFMEYLLSKVFKKEKHNAEFMA